MLHTALHLLESICVSTVSIGLRPTRDAGLDVVATSKRRNHLRKQVVVRGCMWTGADDRHVADQDIEQLRKLIDIGAAQDAAQTRYTWIVSDDLPEIVTIFHHGHRSEFEYANGFVVVAVPRLAKKHRPTGIELDCK